MSSYWLMREEPAQEPTLVIGDDPERAAKRYAEVRGGRCLAGNLIETESCNDGLAFRFTMHGGGLLPVKVYMQEVIPILT